MVINYFPAAYKILKIDNLHKSWFGIKAIDGVSFEVEPGEVVGLIGPNGSGKTTLIDCVSGFTNVDSGSIFLKEEDITGLPPHQIARKGLSRTFQIIKIYQQLSLIDHFLLGSQEFDEVGWLEAIINSKKLRQIEKNIIDRAHEMLNLVGLSSYAMAPAGILSYGQQKLLALAVSLIAKPLIVLLDEPVAGVNPIMIDQIESVIQELHRRGQTFLIIEHNINFVARICNRVIVLDSGRKLAEGTAKIIWEDKKVFEAYIGSTFQI